MRAEADGLYLATTFAGRPLDRVSAHGLGFRARAHVTVTAAGVRIDRDGAAPIDLPAAGVTGAGTATWTIDRTVEPGGLTVLAWSLDAADGARARRVLVPHRSASRVPRSSPPSRSWSAPDPLREVPHDDA